MQVLFVISLLFAASDAWFFSGSGSSKQNKRETPTWDRLSVTFMKFNNLPITAKAAVAEGWKLNKTCSGRNYFAGTRYILKGDTAVMLLFDARGKIAGIQMGVDKSKVTAKKLPWVPEGNMYVITAYFKDPGTICGRGNSRVHVGDRLLIQMGLTYNSTMRIPYHEKDLKNTLWVPGKCFWLMGQHYWYNISRSMPCSKFFPVFIMYNNDKLDGFGWNTDGDLKSPRYEHPTSDRLTYFFDEKTLPMCLKKNAGPLTTQHVYLDRPYTNFC